MVAAQTRSKSIPTLTKDDQKLPASASHWQKEQVHMDVLTTLINVPVAGSTLFILLWAWAFQMVALIAYLFFSVKTWEMKRQAW